MKSLDVIHSHFDSMKHVQGFDFNMNTALSDGYVTIRVIPKDHDAMIQLGVPATIVRILTHTRYLIYVEPYQNGLSFSYRLRDP